MDDHDDNPGLHGMEALVEVKEFHLDKTSIEVWALRILGPKVNEHKNWLQ